MRNRRPRIYKHSLKEEDSEECASPAINIDAQAFVDPCAMQDAGNVPKEDMHNLKLEEGCLGYAMGTIVSPEGHRADANACENETAHKPETVVLEEYQLKVLSFEGLEAKDARPTSDHQLETEVYEPREECHTTPEVACSVTHSSSASDFAKSSLTEKAEHNKIEVSVEGETLKQIKEILNVAGRFSSYIANKEEFSSVESLIIDGMMCKAHCCDALGEKMRRVRFSDRFIYNKRIRGKSGALIFFTEDFKHAIKIIRPKELSVFVKNMPAMSRYLDGNCQSLIVRSVGLYSTPTVSFIVMENVFSSSFGQIFDLKGMNVKREPMGILTESDWKGNRLLLKDNQSMMEAIGKDTQFLESLNLMDYSLVIGRSMDYANAFRAYDGEGKEVEFKATCDGEYSLGIVDVLTEYDFVKKLERIAYLACCMDNASAVHPKKYRDRFMDLVRNECFDEREAEASPENK